MDVHPYHLLHFDVLIGEESRQHDHNGPIQLLKAL